MESTETNQAEVWQVEANGRTYEAAFGELSTWIAEGSLLRIDRVRKGNLRWIEAGKVPALTEFFNSKDAAGPVAPVITSSTTEILGVVEQTNAFVNAFPTSTPVAEDEVCAVHTDILATFGCETCGSLFCKACPNSYGGSVKICPFCGAMCKSLAAAKKESVEKSRHQAAVGEGFGFGDLGRALAYPFRFKFSLVVGAIMFTFFSIGQGAVSFGGIYMLAASIFCFMLANTLTFGILSNTVDNFAQGKLDENFMPSFEDFSLWDDVIHPFFLSIGVYISSFGPFIAVMAIAVFMTVGHAANQMNGLQSDAARTLDPQMPYAANTIDQGSALKQMVNRSADAQKRKVQMVQNGEIETEQMPTANGAEPGEQNIDQVSQLIQDQRKAQLESALGKTPETVAKERQAMISQLLSYGILFLILGGITLLWGLFYFPAACAVAGYTRSFTATLNPTVGLDTIKRLGSSYALILVMGAMLVVVSGLISGILGSMLTAFDLPGVGNVPARAISSFVGFYISIVFSCVIGYALFKGADRLKLYR